MHKDILLSIIIPAYNAAEFLGVALTMLIEQGLENCEVIIINDGSILPNLFAVIFQIATQRYGLFHKKIKVSLLLGIGE
mgnify:CR=1 FL=1